jgi:8-oxo-dGTP diphosphatase
MRPETMAMTLAMRAGRRARRAAASTRFDRCRCWGSVSGLRRSSIFRHTIDPLGSQTVSALFKRVVVRTYRYTPSVIRTRLVRYLTPNFTAGVVTLMVRESGDVLFLRMTYRKGWGLPGGLLDRGESPEVTAQREIIEELGIDVEQPEVYRVYLAPKLQSVTFFTRVRVTEEQVAAMRIDPVEIASAAWFSTTTMPELDDEIAPLMERDRVAAQELIQKP